MVTNSNIWHDCFFLMAVPLKIPLHTNVRWGTADGMSARSYDLRRVSSSDSVSYCASLISSIGDQPVYQLSRSALWSYHLNPPHRLSDQTYPVVSIHLEVSRLGTRSRRSSHHLWCQWHPTFILEWWSAISLACHPGDWRAPNCLGGEAELAAVLLVQSCSGRRTQED